MPQSQVNQSKKPKKLNIYSREPKNGILCAAHTRKKIGRYSKNLSAIIC